METKPKKTNPLWVKCKKCQPFNAVEVWNVLKYLERYFKAKEDEVKGANPVTEPEPAEWPAAANHTPRPTGGACSAVQVRRLRRNPPPPAPAGKGPP